MKSSSPIQENSGNMVVHAQEEIIKNRNFTAFY